MEGTQLLMGIYRERACLVAYLASIWPSYIGYTDSSEPDWKVVTICTDEGQMCWHISPDDEDLFGDVDRHNQPSERFIWDGHTTEEKYERLRALAHREYLGDFDEH
jgi:hypothetical protein